MRTANGGGPKAKGGKADEKEAIRERQTATENGVLGIRFRV